MEKNNVDDSHIFSGWWKGAVIGIIVFITIDFMKTNVSDSHKKAIFKAGYTTAVADFKDELRIKDTIELKKDSVLSKKVDERIDFHWRDVKDLLKNGHSE